MSKNYIYLSLQMLIGCSSASEKSASTHLEISSSEQNTQLYSTRQSETDSLETEDDCVFNNDFKSLTTEWLTELNIIQYFWREDLHGALIPQGQDTVLISQGGCEHFGISVELFMRTESPSITDSIFWIAKALELAETYKMNDYAEMIREGRFRKSESHDQSVLYEVSPEKPIENEIYDGIYIILEKDLKRLSLSKYFN